MGHFSDDYENSAADLVDYYSQPISYIDPSLVSAASFDAAVYSEKAERRQADYGWYWVQTRRVVLLDDSATVRADGVFTIDGKSYRVETIGDKSGARTEIGLVRAEAGEVTRPGYRSYKG